jgi:hypothetical protein
MNASESLILIDHAGQVVNPTDKARALIDEAMSVGALIGSVRNGHENERAANAQLEIKAVQKQIQDAYRAAKDPIVELGRKLDQTFRSLTSELDAEYARIGGLAGQFALAERRRIAAEQVLAKQALDKLEAEKHAAIAATSDPVKHIAVLEEFSRKAAAQLPLPSAPVRAKQQRVREDWNITVLDLIATAKWALVSGRWDVLDISIRVGVVKELLKGGMTEIPGLKCEKTIEGQVTLPRAQKAIDV